MTPQDTFFSGFPDRMDLVVVIEQFPALRENNEHQNYKEEDFAANRVHFTHCICC